jgi:hypothetical protein
MLNIFFPIRLNNNFIFKKRIIIIYITQNNFSAFLVVAHNNKREILKNIYFEFDNKENSNNDVFISSLLSKSILNWEYDYIKLILSSNIAIFKSLHSPFSDIEKIKMTIPFELESRLPFQLSEASVDVIYQNKIVNNEKNKILAVVTKEEYLNFYREIFKKLNLTLHSITIDAVEIIQYDLYYFENSNNSHIVIYNNTDNLLILLFANKELICIKSIDISIDKDAQNNDAENLSIEYTKKVDDNFYIINQIISSLSKDYNFPLNEINLYLININKDQLLIQKLITEYNFKLNNYILDNSKSYINKSVIVSKNNELTIGIENEFIYITSSLFFENDTFNLGHKENTDFKNKILFKQILATIITTALLYIIILSYNFLDLYKTNNQIKQVENQMTTLLKNEFKLSNKFLNSLDSAFIESKKIVEDLQNNLPILVTHNKFLFINLFSELVKNLSNDIKGLQINEMRWKLGTDSPSNLILIGEVSDFDSLHLFEESLKKSNLFITIPQQQDINFNFNLTIAT